MTWFYYLNVTIFTAKWSVILEKMTLKITIHGNFFYIIELKMSIHPLSICKSMWYTECDCYCTLLDESIASVT